MIITKSKYNIGSIDEVTDIANPISLVGDYFDAFSRLRVSDPTGLFSSQSQYDADPIQYETGSTGTGLTSWSSSTRMLSLSATAGTGTAFTQSYQYIPYQPGKSQEIFITGLIGSGVAGAIKDIGYFDSSNGIFLRQNGTSGIQIVRRTSTSGSVVNNSVNQTDWNIDKLDGTGTSGITLDVTKVFILVIDLQFLGMGRVRVGFDIDGIVIYCHEFLNANSLTVPYMQTASLPIQALITASSSSGTATLLFKCASVISEGGFVKDLGYSFGTIEGTATAASGARTHILTVRPLTTFNSLTNRSLFILDDIDILVTGNNSVYWQLCVGASFTANPTYSSVNSSYSSYEQGIGGTFNNLTGGIVIASGYCAATANAKTAISEKISQRFPISLGRGGAVRSLGTLSLLVSGIGGTSATRAVLNFTEIR